MSTFPLPGDKIDDGTVVASVYAGANDDHVLTILLRPTEPYYLVAEYRLADMECLYRMAHPNIVPAVRCYEENGGDY